MAFLDDVHRRSIRRGAAVARLTPAHATCAAVLLTIGLTTPADAQSPDGSATTPRSDPGEFRIPSVLPLNPDQRAKLAQLIADDEQARALTDAVKAEAQPALGRPPRPLAVLHYEGLVNTDPRRVRTVAHLNQMADVARLFRAWQVSPTPDVEQHLCEIILAWADTYVVTGNDVHENKFFPLFTAYDALRERLAENERVRVDRWVREIGRRHHQRIQQGAGRNNRFAKSIRIAAICGRALGEARWIDDARRAAQRLIQQSLDADGASYDLKERDTLTYHNSTLKPLIELSIILDGNAPDALYYWVNDKGGSIQKSVRYVVPYASGEKTRQEWLNSRVALDQRRAAAGIEKYRLGRQFQPRQALAMLELAEYYEPDLTPMIADLTGSDADRFPSWQTLINDACRD